jgi:hypothetical protein
MSVPPKRQSRFPALWRKRLNGSSEAITSPGDLWIIRMKTACILGCVAKEANPLFYELQAKNMTDGRSKLN